MASAVASGIPLRAPPLQLSKSEDRQMSASMVHGAVNFLAHKSNLPNTFPSTSIRRRAHLFPSKRAAAVKINKFKVTSGAESNAGLEGGDSEDGNSMKQSASNILHRRELLWAATGTLSYLSSPGLGQSAPVPPSDLLNCSPVQLATPGQTENCCLPVPGKTPAIDFKFENLPMRIRQPAQLLLQDKNYVAKYNEAYRRMKLLDKDPNDPRSFKNQWHVHCAFCDGAYPEPGNTNKIPLQYHFSWAFLPWHRMYLYFHERILGDLIGDPTFALPFWNWDNQRLDGPLQGGNQLPRIYTDDLGSNNDLLRDAIRNTTRYPPVYVRLTTPQSGSPQDIARANLSILHTSVVTSVTYNVFMGTAYRANQPGTYGPGTAETDGHNVVHNWTGSDNRQRYPDHEDMGTFVYAARDPIFYAHHSNIDRLWSVWSTLSTEKSTRLARRVRKEPSDPDFLNTKFAFYDHKKNLVHVKVSDTLETEKLSFRYQQMESDQDWINFQPRKSLVPKPSQADIEPFAKTETRMRKDEPRSFRLARRKPTDAEARAKSRDDEQVTADDLEETLVIKGVQVPSGSFFAYRVFIDLPGANQDTPSDIEEFVGIISRVSHGRRSGAGGDDHSMSRVDFRLDIGAALKLLNIPNGESVSVTFVPDNQLNDALFDGLEVEFN